MSNATATEYTPIITRKVIIQHGPSMVEVLIHDLEVLESRNANVGEQLEAIREGPVRYSTLAAPLQSLKLDFSLFCTKTRECLEALAADLHDHEHEFSVSVQSQPRHS